MLLASLVRPGLVAKEHPPPLSNKAAATKGASELREGLGLGLR